MNGIIVIDKPINMTSHDVVSQVRKTLKTKKVGHLGTLDPLASGVLVVCVGDATKLAQFIENVEKTYLSTICIGKTTSTLDRESVFTEIKKVEKIDENTILSVLDSFLGKSLQYPPIFSAIKVNGRKLYDLARKGEEIQIEPREIEIKSIKMVSPITYEDDSCYFQFLVTASKGTYIRSLCRDIANKLGYPGYMKALRRISSGCYNIKNADTLEEVKNNNFTMYSMLSSLSDFPKLEDPEFIEKAKNGMKISPKAVFDIFKQYPSKIVIHQGEKLIAIYQYQESCYQAARVWN